MKPLRGYFIPFLTLVAVGALAVAWIEYQELVGLRATAVGPDERADLQKRVWDAQKRIKDPSFSSPGHPSARRSASRLPTRDSDPNAGRGPAGGGGLASPISSPG